MSVIILSASTNPIDITYPIGYVIGIIIALFIFGYLIYSLVKPEKF